MIFAKRPLLLLTPERRTFEKIRTSLFSYYKKLAATGQFLLCAGALRLRSESSWEIRGYLFKIC